MIMKLATRIRPLVPTSSHLTSIPRNPNVSSHSFAIQCLPSAFRVRSHVPPPLYVIITSPLCNPPRRRETKRSHFESKTAFRKTIEQTIPSTRYGTFSSITLLPHRARITLFRTSSMGTGVSSISLLAEETLRELSGSRIKVGIVRLDPWGSAFSWGT